MRRQALYLVEKGWGIVETLGISSKSITRWENNYEEYGRVDPQTMLRGRPRILTSTMTEDLREIINLMRSASGLHVVEGSIL
jgi:transposase